MGQDAGMHPLVSTADLDASITRGEPPVVLDLRWRLNGPPGRDSYAAGHLPGAVYLDIDGDLSAEPGAGGRHPLPEPEHLQAVLRAAGVTAGRAVVAYDDADGSVAARAWWLLRWAGHPEVGILDGGFAAWVAEGRAVTTEVPRPAAGDIVVRAGQLPVVDAAEAAALARAGSLLDARANPRYLGDVEPIDPRAGHIPGAVNAPFTGHVGPDGRWLPPAQLRARFEELGVADDRPAGAYCGSGVTASAVVLALELAGRSEPAALYAGSWSHWSSDPERPVATGPEPG